MMKKSLPIMLAAFTLFSISFTPIYLMQNNKEGQLSENDKKTFCTCDENSEQVKEKSEEQVIIGNDSSLGKLMIAPTVEIKELGEGDDKEEKQTDISFQEDVLELSEEDTFEIALNQDLQELLVSIKSNVNISSKNLHIILDHLFVRLETIHKTLNNETVKAYTEIQNVHLKGITSLIIQIMKCRGLGQSRAVVSVDQVQEVLVEAIKIIPVVENLVQDAQQGLEGDNSPAAKEARVLLSKTTKILSGLLVSTISIAALCNYNGWVKIPLTTAEFQLMCRYWVEYVPFLNYIPGFMWFVGAVPGAK